MTLIKKLDRKFATSLIPSQSAIIGGENVINSPKDGIISFQDDIIDYIAMTIPDLCINTAEQPRKEIVEYLSDMDNYAKIELEDAIEAYKWWLIGLMDFGTKKEVKDFVDKPLIPFLLKEAMERLQLIYKTKLERLFSIDYQVLEADYQLNNTLRIFEKESAIAIGDYENYLILASENYCHVIDTKKTSLNIIHTLFSNGKVNIFYKAKDTLKILKKNKIIITNNIFDVTSAYKLLWGEAVTEEEIDQRVDAELGNLSDKEKAIRKTQYLLKVRKDLRQQIIDKQLIDSAKQVFETIKKSFGVGQDIFEQAKKIKEYFGGEIIYSEKSIPTA